MQGFGIDKFQGIDLRPGRYGEDVPALSVGTNVAIIPGGSMQTRPALIKVSDLHAQSVGLYARGGLLRAVVPGGQSIQDSAPPSFVYDPIGDGTAYPLSVLSRLVAADTYGVTQPFGPNGYVAVKRSDTGKVEHHFLQAPPASSATAVSTLVNLPFQVGEALTKLKTKMWAPTPSEAGVRGSSSANGPSDWSAVSDAVLLPVLSHISGARDVLTLCHHRGRLAVFFYDAIQLWQVDPSPSFCEVEQIFNGPGAVLAGSVANTEGDVVYLGRSGFGSLNTVIQTGEADPNDIGAPILELTKLIDGTTPAVALWVESKSWYLCAIGTTVYCGAMGSDGKVNLWTVWTLPVSVDYMVENQGLVYVRSGNTLYRLDDTMGTDYNGVAIAGSVRLRDLSLKAPGKLKTMHWLTIRQTAAATWQLIVDGIGLRARSLPACSPKSIRLPFGGEGRQISVQITTSGLWRLEGFNLEYEVQGT